MQTELKSLTWGDMADPEETRHLLQHAHEDGPRFQTQGQEKCLLPAGWGRDLGQHPSALPAPGRPPRGPQAQAHRPPHGPPGSDTHRPAPHCGPLVSTDIWEVQDIPGDVKCKVLLFLHKVMRGPSLGTTCVLSVLQALTISPSGSSLANFKVKSANPILGACLFLWVLTHGHYQRPAALHGGHPQCHAAWSSPCQQPLLLPAEVQGRFSAPGNAQRRLLRGPHGRVQWVHGHPPAQTSAVLPVPPRLRPGLCRLCALPAHQQDEEKRPRAREHPQRGGQRLRQAQSPGPAQGGHTDPEHHTAQWRNKAQMLTRRI
ncbi:uncharacterized protein LOC125611755 [Marmota marmota marmota]|uniref:uncharacterized protein LOC125611755 n=1 Tax=Marmota marmota marmota TaxID=9994 RepID=UPI002093FAA7|nr:uncharacterized protein LOC125611755 [Marmota marmota marmota]